MTTFNPDLDLVVGATGAEETTTAARTPGKAAKWTGRGLSALMALLLGLDAVMKLLQVAPVMKATAELGYPTSSAFGIGVVLAICVAAYAVPRTAVLGAVLLTGYLGGAIATHVRVGDPLWTHTLFPIYVAALVWGGLFLRNQRLRAFLKASFAPSQT